MEHLGEDLLFAFLDEALSATEQQRVETHLASCPACADQLAHWGALFASMEMIPDQVFTTDLAPRVLKRLQAPVSTAPRIRWIGTAQLLVALLTAGLAWPLFRSTMLSFAFSWPTWSPLQARLLIEWQSLMNALTHWWSRIIDFGRIPLPQPSLAFALSLLIVTVLIWAIGTRFILHGVQTNQGGRS